MSRTSREVHSSWRAISSGERLAAELLHELALDVHDLVELLDHVDRDADRPPLVRDRARDRLADPPRRVGRELVAAAVVELLDRADEAERALLDQVQERQAAAQVALGDRDDEAQVGLHHLLLGDQVAALDPLRERDLALGGEQLDAADRAQVEAQRVQARLDREVDLRLARGVGRLRLLPASCRLEAATFRRGRLAIRADDVDPLALQVRVQLRDLLLGDLHLFQRGGDLLERQEASFLAFGDERTKLVDLRDRRVARQQCIGLCCQTLIFRDECLSNPLLLLHATAGAPAFLCGCGNSFHCRGLNRSGPGNKVLIGAPPEVVPCALAWFVARNSPAVLEKPWAVRDAFWAQGRANGHLSLPEWTNIGPPRSRWRTSRAGSRRCTSRSRAWASRTSRRSSASRQTGASSSSPRSSTASSTSARARRARTCRASRRSSTTRSAR